MLPLPLVDVDCNLWHQDLASLQNKDNDSLSLSDKIQEFLQEDAIQEANIVAMLSPSSTIVEAELTISLTPLDLGGPELAGFVVNSKNHGNHYATDN